MKRKKIDTRKNLKKKKNSCLFSFSTNKLKRQNDDSLIYPFSSCDISNVQDINENKKSTELNFNIDSRILNKHKIKYNTYEDMHYNSCCAFNENILTYIPTSCSSSPCLSSCFSSSSDLSSCSSFLNSSSPSVINHKNYKKKLLDKKSLEEKGKIKVKKIININHNSRNSIEKLKKTKNINICKKNANKSINNRTKNEEKTKEERKINESCKEENSVRKNDNDDFCIVDDKAMYDTSTITNDNDNNIKNIKEKRNSSYTKISNQECVVLHAHSDVPRSLLQNNARVGLFNLSGGSCFLNVIIQLLTHIKPFRDFYLHCDKNLPSKKYLGKLHDEYIRHLTLKNGITCNRHHRKLFQGSSISWQIAVVFNHLWRSTGSVKYLKPDALYAACIRIIPHFDPCEMQDCDEFFRHLLDILDCELKAAYLGVSIAEVMMNAKTSHNVKTPITCIFEGKERDEILCNGCGNLSYHEVPFKNLSIEMTKLAQNEAMQLAGSKPGKCFLTLSKVDLKECLNMYFREDHDSLRLENGEGYYCSVCKSKQNATKRIRLYRKFLPFVLCLSLKRFIRAKATYKIWNPVIFEEKLDLSRFVYEQNENENQHKKDEEEIKEEEKKKVSSLNMSCSPFLSSSCISSPIVALSPSTSFEDALLISSFSPESSSHFASSSSSSSSFSNFHNLPARGDNISTENLTYNPQFDISVASNSCLGKNCEEFLSCNDRDTDIKRNENNLSEESNNSVKNEKERTNVVEKNIIKKEENKKGCVYELCGVIEHTGLATEKGHYCCYVKHSHSRKWIYANDKTMDCVCIERVLSANPYMLIYQKINVKDKLDLHYSKFNHGIEKEIKNSSEKAKCSLSSNSFIRDQKHYKNNSNLCNAVLESSSCSQPSSTASSVTISSSSTSSLSCSSTFSSHELISSKNKILYSYSSSCFTSLSSVYTVSPTSTCVSYPYPLSHLSTSASSSFFNAHSNLNDDLLTSDKSVLPKNENKCNLNMIKNASQINSNFPSLVFDSSSSSSFSSSSALSFSSNRSSHAIAAKSSIKSYLSRVSSSVLNSARIFSSCNSISSSSCSSSSSQTCSSSLSKETTFSSSSLNFECDKNINKKHNKADPSNNSNKNEKCKKEKNDFFYSSLSYKKKNLTSQKPRFISLRSSSFSLSDSNLVLSSSSLINCSLSFQKSFSPSPSKNNFCKNMDTKKCNVIKNCASSVVHGKMDKHVYNHLNHSNFIANSTCFNNSNK